MTQQTTNPFELTLEAAEKELLIRQARRSYLSYVTQTNQNYIPSKFHTYLCNEVQKFLETSASPSFDILLLSVPPQHGKGHPVDTPVLTSNGFKMFGDLVVGDEVYSDNGNLVKVTHTQDPYEWNIVEVVLDTGETIQCSPEHLWKYNRSIKSRKFKIDTIIDETQNIFKKYNAKSPSISVTKPLNVKINNPTIDPYFYGLWLGDGYSGKSYICGASDDMSFYLTQIPYAALHHRHDKSIDVIRFDLKHKYITPKKTLNLDFLNWSYSDRLSLLQGLMDTDGYINKRGTCEFTTIHKELADNVLLLIRTLGIKGNIVIGDATLNGKVVSKKYRVCFTANKDDMFFRLPRKLNRIKNKTTKDRNDKYKYFIKEIRPVGKKLHRCITVEGGMYLIGKGLIPTHNSTSITETLPAWYLGKYPDKQVIICGYNEDFAIRFGRRNKEKIEEFNKNVFPDCTLAEAPRSNVEFETTKKGRCISRGLLSGLTGNTADLFIIDDPIKNRQEADSETTRKTIFNEYLNSVRTRIKPKGKLIVIQTRWHEEDLFGMIAQIESDTTIINIPCECDDPENDPLGRKMGEALCPEIGRGNAWLNDFKQAYIGKEGSRAWTALYQGKPVAIEGNFFKREWWRYYSPEDLPAQFPYTIISVDAAFKDGDDNDFVAIQVWGKENNKYYLLDNIKKHLNFVDTLDAIRSLKWRYPDTLFILIEDKANGTAATQVLSMEMDGVIPINPEGGKVARANAVSPAIEAGRVYLPRYGSFVDDFVSECCSFPNGAHDDQVDAMTQALNRMLYVDADVIAETFKIYKTWTEDMFEDYYNADGNDDLQAELIKLWGYPTEWKAN